MANFTFGTDPEFMLADRLGTPRTAIGPLPTKKSKIKVGNFGFYYDNVLSECTVPAASSKDEAVATIKEMFRHLHDLVGPKLHPIIKAGHDYDESEMKHEDARMAGCKPESCAYDLEKKQDEREWIRKEFRRSNFRTAGGHIHLGTEHGKRWLSSVCLVRVLDLFVGLPLLYLDNDPTSAARRKYYGQPGRYRQPSYGVEYRTLSNYWFSNPYLVELTYDLCDFALDFVEQGRDNELYAIDKERLMSDDFWNDGGDPVKCFSDRRYNCNELRKTFVTGDANGIRRHLEVANEYLPVKLVNRYESLKARTYDSLAEEWD